MNAVRIEAVVEHDGELHLRDLPWRKGDRLEAIVLKLDASANDMVRAEMLQRFMEQARSAKFCSSGPYPVRDELHERS